MSGRRLDQLLVERGLCASRGKARDAIEAGRVTIDGRPAVKPAELVGEDAVITAEAAYPWVGRGGIKLDHALAHWPVTVEGAVVLDIGASTGGFTDVCLSRGAAKVYAVDVGRAQMHPRIAADARVVELSGLDARKLTVEQVPETPDLVVCDASFIGLAKVLPVALGLARPGTDLVALVKPQFEAGPEGVGRGGIVRDENVHARILEEVRAWLQSIDWQVREVIPSPVTGSEGNREYLLWAVKA